MRPGACSGSSQSTTWCTSSRMKPTKDILKLGGVQETDIFAPPLQSSLHRFPWLLINLGTAILASIVIALFEKTIQQLVALAVLMPIVASMGGNGGTQTVT